MLVLVPEEFTFSPISKDDQFNYLGVTFNANHALTAEVSPIKCIFYAALDLQLVKCCSNSEPVEVWLSKSLCLPELVCLLL